MRCRPMSLMVNCDWAGSTAGPIMSVTPPKAELKSGNCTRRDGRLRVDGATLRLIQVRGIDDRSDAVLWPMGERKDSALRYSAASSAIRFGDGALPDVPFAGSAPVLSAIRNW